MLVISFEQENVYL